MTQIEKLLKFQLYYQEKLVNTNFQQAKMFYQKKTGQKKLQESKDLNIQLGEELKTQRAIAKKRISKIRKAYEFNKN